MQFSVEVRNERLDAIETAVGATPILRIFTGSAPANTGAADSGTELVEMDLPSSWLADAASGAKALAGVWSGLAGATGDPGHYRIYNSGDTTCHIQGPASTSGGGGEMILDDDIASGQTVTVSAFNVAEGNA